MTLWLYIYLLAVNNVWVCKKACKHWKGCYGYLQCRFVVLTLCPSPSVIVCLTEPVHSDETEQ